MTATEPQTYDSLLSPDGTQRATLIIYPCVAIPEQEGEEAVFEYAYEQVNIINVNSGAERPMVDQLRYCGGVGAFGLELLFWSPSGRFLYYTTAREGSPDGCGYWWQPSFRRVNQSSGESEELGRGTLSPDRGKIAVWDRANRQLVVWETDGGEVGRTPAVASHLALGPISWSPKGDALVYLQGSGSCWPDTTYLMHVPLASMEPSLLLETSTPIITEVSWLDGQRLRLVDKEGGERVFELPPGSPD